MVILVTGTKVFSKVHLDMAFSNLNYIVQLLSTDEHDAWHDYFHGFLSSTISEYNMSWKSIIIVSIQINMTI